MSDASAARLLLCVSLFSAQAAVAQAQQPVVFNAYGPDLELPPLNVTSSQFVDIPGSEMTVTVPAGTAVISWSMSVRSLNSSTIGVGSIRPVIGTVAPSGMPVTSENSNPKGFSGNWVTTTAGGTITVKLQAQGDPTYPFNV